jgi:hypothetical protein
MKEVSHRFTGFQMIAPEHPFFQIIDRLGVSV